MKQETKKRNLKQATIGITIAVVAYVAFCAAFWWLNTNYPMLGLAVLIVSLWAVIYKMFYSEQSQNTDEL